MRTLHCFLLMAFMGLVVMNSATACIDTAPSREVGVGVIDTGRDVSTPAVAVDGTVLVLTWAESLTDEVDPATTQTDIYYQLVPVDGIPETGEGATPAVACAGNQGGPHPLISDFGRAVAWTTRSEATAPKLSVLWKGINDETSCCDAKRTALATDNQWDPQLAIANGLAAIVYLDRSDTDGMILRASLIDLGSGAIVREVELSNRGLDMDQTSHSVTAGENRFLALWREKGTSRSPGATESGVLIAALLDFEGEITWGPTQLSGDVPSFNWPWEAGFHEGSFFVPVYPYVWRESDRACCLFCESPNQWETTCTYRDYDVAIQLISENGTLLGDPYCVDCKAESWPASVRQLMISSDAAGVYLFWADPVLRLEPSAQGGRFLVRVTADQLSVPKSAWRDLSFPAAPEGFERGFDSFIVADGTCVLVGTLSTPLGTEQQNSRVWLGSFNFD